MKLNDYAGSKFTDVGRQYNPSKSSTYLRPYYLKSEFFNDKLTIAENLRKTGNHSISNATFALLVILVKLVRIIYKWNILRNFIVILSAPTG